MGDKEDDAALLKFGRDFDDVEFISNATVSVLLTAIRDQRLTNEADGRGDASRPSEAFERAREYAGRFGGALSKCPAHSIDELTDALIQLRLALTPEAIAKENAAARAKRGGGGGGGGGGGDGAFEEEGAEEADEDEAAWQRPLHSFEVVALTNLSPPTVAAAKSLVPSLEKFRDDDVEMAVALLRKSAARAGGAGEEGEGGDGGGGGGGGGGGAMDDR